MAMSRLMELAGECAHKRSIEMSTYSVDEDHIVSKGTLRDVRMKDYYLFTGEKKDAGTLHDLSLVLLIKVPDMIIEDVEVILDTVPRNDCRFIKHTLDPVIGMSFRGGFSSKVRKAAGGSTGCTHLVNLITTMAPAVMQGYWAWYFQKKHDAAEVIEMQKGRGLKDSCYTWREDGEAYRKLMEYCE